MISDDRVTQLQVSVAFLIVYVALAYVVGRYAQSRGHAFMPPFVLCFFLSPIAVALIVCMIPRKTRPKPMPLEMILEIEKARLQKEGKLSPESA